MSIGTNCNGAWFHCSVCGKEFWAKPHGRLPEYCSSDCRDYSKYRNAMERALVKIQFASNDAAKMVRGDIFSSANLVKIGGKS